MINEQAKNNTSSKIKNTVNQNGVLTNTRKTDYTSDHREMVVSVWNSGAYNTVAECAKAYDMSESTLYTWISRSKKPVEIAKSPEYSILQKENSRLKMELEILKKAAIYFASHAK